MPRLRHAPRKVGLILLTALIALTLGLAAPAAARGPGGGGGKGHWNGHGGGHGGGPGWRGAPPPGHRRVVVRGAPYYFWGGRYYRPWRGGYMSVFPPVGLVISVLPPGFRVMVFGGINYYLYNGIYYRPAPGGYVVVSPPAAVPAQTVVSAPTGVVAPAQGSSGTATVIAQALNVRSGPGLAYPVLQVVNLGADLSILGRTGSWLFVRSPNGDSGWVSQEFTTQTSGVPASG
ncbi:MAG: SH3 domain-containing protein [Deltaproteobacteria bacterium]|nr:SH3 domain-containing protein [Deltaproteobacteria bacterium]